MQQEHRGTQQDALITGKPLRIESKLFFLDLKENQRGIYLKLSERTAQKERSTIVIPRDGLPYFEALLKHFAENIPSQSGELPSKELAVESKVFYFEARQNAKGRFLQISESGSRGRTPTRTSLIVPSGGADCSGWLELSVAVKELYRVVPVHQTKLPEASPSDSGIERLQELSQELHGLGLGTIDVSGPSQVVGPGPSAPTSGRTSKGARFMKAGHKSYYFDFGSNQKGEYLKVTEAVGNERKLIIIPAAALKLFSSLVQECVDEQENTSPYQPVILPTRMEPV